MPHSTHEHKYGSVWGVWFVFDLWISRFHTGVFFCFGLFVHKTPPVYVYENMFIFCIVCFLGIPRQYHHLYHLPQDPLKVPFVCFCWVCFFSLDNARLTWVLLWYICGRARFMCEIYYIYVFFERLASGGARRAARHVFFISVSVRVFCLCIHFCVW